MILLALVATLLTACRPGPVVAPSPAPIITIPPAQVALDALRSAVLRHDRPAFDRQISGRDPAFPAVAGALYQSLTSLSLTRLTLKLRPLGQDLGSQRRALLGSRAFVQQVSVGWRVPGDVGAASQLIWVTFLPGPGATTIAGTFDGPNPPTAAEPLWLTGQVTVRRSRHTTVLGTAGQPPGPWVARAEAATAAVRHRLMSGAAPGWNGELVLELPATRSAFEHVLGVAPGSYAQIAAVAWPEGPQVRTAAIRVVVNPEQTARLDEQGLAVLLTHETVHVATRSAASRAPTWLVEGLADYVAYARYPQTAPTAAAALLQRVRQRGAPAAIPDDAQFSPVAPDLALSYAEAWTVCRMLAETYSANRLERFYRAVSSGVGVEQALRSEFGSSTAQLTSRWRAHLAALARRR